MRHVRGFESAWFAKFKDPMRFYRLVKLDVFLACGIFLVSSAHTASAADGVRIPRVSAPPRLEDFDDMTPRGDSAQLAKVTAVANAQAFRNQTVPAAQASALASENDARAEGAQNLSVAAGEAWSFRTIESQYRSSPSEYFFRRRLETLENNLGGRHFTIVDSRIQRDGGDLWLTQ